MSNSIYEQTVIGLLSLILRQLVHKDVTEEDYISVIKNYWSR